MSRPSVAICHAYPQHPSNNETWPKAFSTIALKQS